MTAPRPRRERRDDPTSPPGKLAKLRALQGEGVTEENYPAFREYLVLRMVTDQRGYDAIGEFEDDEHVLAYWQGVVTR
jgi:hypothetical protein